jgi:hypothetical protein
MNSFGVPHIRNQPYLKVVEPEATPWENRASERYVWSPKTDAWKVQTQALRLLIVYMRKFASAREFLEVWFAHPHVRCITEIILKLHQIGSAEFARRNRADPPYASPAPRR